MEEQSITVSIDGKDLTFKTGKIARQANGAVVVQSGETILLSTACARFEHTEADFFPLRVDYTEKFSSAGKTLGGFIKREGKPTEREVLLCRLIDRPIRPLFETGFFCETQVITKVLSYDGVCSPDPLAICAASAALVISDIPLKKPIGAVRIGLIDGNLVVNPTIQEMQASRLDLMIAGTSDAVLMIEGYCDFLTESEILKAIAEGHQWIKKICESLSEWQNVVGKEKNRDFLRSFNADLYKQVENFLTPSLLPTLEMKEKQQREEALSRLKAEAINHFCNAENTDWTQIEIEGMIKKATAHHMRQMVLNTNKRCDGRNCNEVRPVWIETNLLPRTHGSALFTRGETQALAVCTLGSESMGQRYETLDDSDGLRRFYLQYSFPPYSVGEVGRMGPPGRREVGHGKLAERALLASVPLLEEFPYTIRLESNITESNGSSSMASVCGGCLALMAGGVPIKRPIAGIAMGLILDESCDQNRYAILSDILGVEDALGDMDFKVTGDETGITAFQLDIKIEGITPNIMEAALLQAKEGRTIILQKMLKAYPKTEPSLSKYAPRIESLTISPSKIGTVIGPGGKQIRAIIEETGVDININDNGVVDLCASNMESIEKAKEIIHNLVAEVEIGKTYQGKVVTVRDFGAFVAILSKEGLCHISELAHERVEDIHQHVKEGQALEVKVLDINDRGQIRLSHKATLGTDASRPRNKPKPPPKKASILPPPPIMTKQ